MFYKKIFLVLLILVTAGNLYIYVNRNNYIFVKQSTYAQIYPNYNLGTIKKFNKINDSTLEVVLNKTNKKLTDESKIIKLQKGVNAYKIAGASSTDSITIAVEYYATQDYAKQGNSLNGGITIYNTPLPQAAQLTDLSKWRDDEITVSPQEEVAVKQLLKDSMGITESESTINKVKKIGTYLSYKLRNAVGLPTDSLLRLSVFNQYKSGLNGVKIWCGNYATIFNLFAKNAGIKTRYVEINKTVNGFAGNLHIFNEYYIPEQKKWAAIDLLYNNVFYTRSNGALMNAVEVKNTNEDDSTVHVAQAVGDTLLKSINFNKLENNFFYTYNSTKDLKFFLSLDYNEGNNFTKKIKRYFSKRYYYELYSDTELINNNKFYFKQLLLLLQLIFTAIFALAFIAKFIAPKNDRV